MHRTFVSEMPPPFGSPPITYCGVEVVPGPIHQYETDGRAEGYLDEGVRASLLGELALAEAPFTGRGTACVIQTDQAPYFYSGHVVEYTPGNFEAAETMALAKIISPEAKIGAVYVTGMGVEKPKHVMPSAASYDALSPRFMDDTQLIVLKPNTFDAVQVIYGCEHPLAYAPREYSAFESLDVYSSKEEAWEKTPLNELDCEFIAHLRHQGLDSDTHFYLTGSASGRGGPSNLLDSEYRDLDIIAVSEEEPEQAIARLVGLGEVFYNKYDATAEWPKIKPKTVTVWSTGETRHGFCIKFQNKTIDFFVAKDLKKAFVRPETYERNFFHQLS